MLLSAQQHHILPFSELGYLGITANFDVSDNALGSSLPTELGYFVALTSGLRFENNSFTGAIHKG